MKTILLILGTLILAAVLVAIGWRFGRDRRAMDELYVESVLEKRIGEGEVAVSMLHSLDAGDLNSVRGQLQWKVVMSVMTVNALSPYADTKSRQLARNLFAQITKYRAEGSPSFTNKLGNWSDDTIARFEAVLQRASQEQAK